VNNKQRILIVDDESANASVIADYLNENGFEVMVAHNATEGMECVINDHPDLLVLDLFLPDMAGTELCVQLRSQPSTRYIPIILCTANNISTEDKLKGFKSGVDDFLIRPFEMSELLARIQAILRRSRVHPPLDLLQQIKSVVQPDPPPLPPPSVLATLDEGEDALTRRNRPAMDISPEGRVQRTLSLFKRLGDILINPRVALENIESHHDFFLSLLIIFLTPTIASLSKVTGIDSSFDSWLSALSLGLAKSGVTWFAIAGILQLVFPFFDQTLSTKSALILSGLSASPRAVGGLLSFLYSLLLPSGLGTREIEFSAGINLIPGIPSVDWINFFSRVGLFDLWSSWILLTALLLFCKERNQTAKKLILFVGLVSLIFGALTPY